MISTVAGSRTVRGWISACLTPLFGLGLFLVIRSTWVRSDASAVAAEPNRVASFRWKSGPIFSLEWSPDGTSLASTYWGSDLGIYRVPTGRLSRVRFDVEGVRSIVGWSADDPGPTLWALDGSISIKSTARPGVDSPDETSRDRAWPGLARTCRGRSIRLWGPTDRREEILPDSARPANCLAISPDGLTIASGGGDGFVRLTDVRQGRERLAWKFDPRPINYGGISMLAFSPDGRTLAASGVGPIRIYDPGSGEERGRIDPTAGGHSNLSFSPDGRRLASATWSGLLQLWDTGTGAELRRLTPTTTRIVALAWSPDGRALASGGFDGEVSIWEVDPASSPESPGRIAAR